MKGYFPENSPEKGSETLTYIDRINEFHLWLESNALPVLSQLMYYNLLHVFNRAGWPEYVQVDNLRMMIWLGGASKTTVIRAREKLAAAGFIRVKRGGKGCPNRYELVDLRYSHATINDTQNDTRNATRTDTPSDTHIKTKTKTKKESSCAEQSSPPVIELPLNDGTGFAVSQEQCQEWAGLYPAVDVIQQLRNMKGWLLSNPRKRKTRSGVARFVNSWLSKEQNRGGGSAVQPEPPPAPEPYHYPTPEEDCPRQVDDTMDWRDLI